MAFVKPKVNEIKADISNISIYLRSTKKFGKTTLFRDVVLEKYGDPSYGLLVGCGAEIGYKMLDHLNYTQATSWQDLLDLKEWLIAEKDKEHHIKMVAFDTVDELVLLADNQTIRISNKENPSKMVRSIKAAMGGYTAGEKYSANNLIKPYFSELQRAGFATWAIAHTKLKTIRDKGALEEEGYMQLTSNLGADYEAAFGDVMDVCLTGVIDRETETKGSGDEKKNYVTDTVRKLYFRGTPMVDAGGRFADGTVPEYLIFDKTNMAKDFIKIVEEGMENSRIGAGKTTSSEEPKKKSKPAIKVTEEPKKEIQEVAVEEPEDIDVPPFDVDEPEDENEKKKQLIAQIKGKFAGIPTEKKKIIKEIIVREGDGGGMLNETLSVASLEKILGIANE